nr:amino acid ABC transporter substrate-binding protein [Maliibacterium massiliense]
MKKTITMILVLVLALALCLTGCKSKGADTSLKDIQSKGKLVMGLDDSFPPMGFRDDNNEIVGFDIDLARAVAEKLGVELQLQPIDWKAKEMELNNKNVDVLWNGFTLTDERKENLLCSEPYMFNKQIIVVNADSDIKAKADLAGKTVALQDGSSAEEALEKDTALKDSLKGTVGFSDNVKALLDLSNGQVDAVLVDSVVANYYIHLDQNEGKFRILDDSLAAEEYGIGMRKGDASLKEAIDKAIADLIADGTFKTLSEKWFSEDVSIKK